MNDSSRELPEIDVVAALIEREGLWLLGRRPEEAHLGGAWEFPGGKVEAGESHAEALQRELREELAVEAEIGPLAARTEREFERFRARLFLYRARLLRDEPSARWHAEIGWFRFEELDTLPIAASNRPFVAALRAR